MAKKYLNEVHDLYRDSLKKFLEKEVRPHYDQWEEDRLIPRDLWTKMGENGFLCPWVDESYGGLNADFGYSVVFNEEIERVGSGLVGLGLHNDIVVPYFESYGTDEQKERWLKKCVTGEYITAIAMTEPDAGSDLAGIKSTAINKGDHYILNGQKTFITNGIHADLVVVVAKTDPNANPAHKGISLFVVDKDMKGFSRGRKLDKVGLHSQDTAELFFEDVKVPKENLLGEEGKGFYYLMAQLQQERLTVAISGQVAAEEMLEMTTRYIKERKAFSQPISKLQTVQHKVAEMATEVKIGRSFLDDVIERHMNNESVVTEVSMAKWWITDMARRTSTTCMQLHGGYGYMEEYEIARRYRDIPVASIYAGTNDIMKNIIAKNMGL
ncbi:acyl-CoA dehydrogenase family protein [Alkalibacillus silvisoli]|uniref:Acyl-CoA dehydrogenase family protein n=1 Tax=Alkalibacillus silvisoli TaxID=392823 RepID=A0ABP3JVA9_9BACI